MGLNEELLGRTPTCGVDTVVATQEQDLSVIADDWQRMHAACTRPQRNTDPAHYMAMLRILGETFSPYVAMVKAGGAACGMVIGQRSTSRVKCSLLKSPRLACLHVAYGGLLTDGTPAGAAAVSDYLRGLLRDRVVDCLMVNHLDAGHELYADVEAGLGTGRRAVCRSEAHWRAALVDPKTGKRIEHPSSKRRYQFRRYDRLLCEHFDGQVVLRRYEEPREAIDFLAIADAITRKGYQGSLGVGLMDTPVWRRAVEEVAHAGQMRSYVLTGRGEPIAFAHGCVYRGVFTLIATAYLPAHADISPGRVTLQRVFADLAADGVGTCDFGFGDAEYKQLHGTESWQEATMHVYGSSSRALAAYAMERLTVASARAARRGAASLGALKAVKRAVRARMQSGAKVDE